MATIGRGIIELVADATQLKAGISDAKSSLNTLRDAAKNAGETLNQQGIKYIRTLEKQDARLKTQAATFGLAKSEIAAYNAAQLGIGKTADSLIKSLAASEAAIKSKAKADRDAATDAQKLAARQQEQKGFLSGMQQKVDIGAGKLPSELGEIKAAQIGLVAQSRPLIAALNEQEKAFEKAASVAKRKAQADKDAAIAANFLRDLQSKVDIGAGKLPSELQAIKAAQIGVTAQSQPLIAALNAQEKALAASASAAKAKAQADREAANAAQQLAARQQAQQGFQRDLQGKVDVGAGKLPSELAAIKAAQLGVTEQSKSLIASLAAQEKAFAAAAAEAKAKAQADREAGNAAQKLAAQQQTQQGFLRDLQGKVDVGAGKLPSELLALKAAQVGVVAQSGPLIASLAAQEKALAAAAAAAKAKTQADREAAAAAQQFAAQQQAQQSFLRDLQSKVDVGAGKLPSELLAIKAAQLGVTAQSGPLIAALAAQEKGLGNLATNARVARFQSQQLGFQLHDFFIQLQAGQNPLTAFLQQGSQLSGTFGGAGNAFRAVTKLISPMVVGIAGAAAALGTFGLAVAHIEGLQRGLNDLQAQLSATGRAGQVSGAQLRVLIDDLARAPGVTREAATGVIGELTKTHQIGVDLFKGISNAAVDFAKATGTALPDAAKTLAAAIAEPEKGVRTLEAALGRMSSTQLLAIERMVRQNDVIGAQRELLAAVEQQVRGLALNGLTPLQKAANDLGNAWDSVVRSFEKSDGLQRVNTLIAGTVSGISGLITAMHKADAEWRSAFSGGLNGLMIRAVDALKGRPASTGGASGSFAPSTGGASGSFAPDTPVAAPGLPGADKTIKTALELGKAYEGVTGQIERLKDTHKTLQSAQDLAAREFGKNSEQYKKLATQIAGVNDAIASAQKKGAGGAPKRDREPEEVRRALLDAALNTFRGQLAEERDTIAFHQREVQALYQAGNISLREFYDTRNLEVAKGVRAEKNQLEKEQAELRKNIADPLVQKNPSERIKLEAQLAESIKKSGQVTVKAAQDAKLAILEEDAAFKQLADSVANFRADLKMMQGDEIGAARIRADQAIQQARELAKRSQNAPEPADRITPEQLASQETLIRQNLILQKTQTETSRITERLSIEEERIALRAQTGILSENGALIAQGEARRKVIGLLADQLAAQEKVAAEQRREGTENPQLLINIERTRLELEKLAAVLDPLKDKFDNLFKDAGSSALADFLNGTKSLKAAANDFLKTISTNINNQAAKAISDQAFGEKGIFSGVGGFFADAFRKGEKTSSSGDEGGFLSKIGGLFGFGKVSERQVSDSVAGFGGGTLTDIIRSNGKQSAEQKELAALFKAPAIDTSSITASLTNLQTAGIDPSTIALTAFKQAVDGAAGSLQAKVGASAPTGEQSIADMFKVTSRDPSSRDYENESDRQSTSAEANADFERELTSFTKQFQQCGRFIDLLGGSAKDAQGALGLMPSIISAFSSAISSIGTAAKSSGGDWISSLFSAFSGGGGATTNLSTGYMHSGGIVGSSGTKKLIPARFFAGAPKYHDGGIVGQRTDLRGQPIGVFAGAPAYHEGGAVAAAPASTPSVTLAANEVPTILMGGPRGTREEVLHARDPRHADNIAPSLLQALKGGVGGDAIAKAIGGLGGEGGRAVGGVGGPGGDATVTQIKESIASTNAGPIGAVTPRAPKAEPKRSFRVLHDGGLVGKSGKQRSIPVNVFTQAIKYHDGGIVGQRTDLRGIPINVFVDAPKYHEGGVAGAPGAPGGSATAIGGIGGPGGVGASAGQTIVGLTGGLGGDGIGGKGGDAIGGLGGKGGDARGIFVSAAQQIIVPALTMLQGAAGIGGEAIAKAIGGLGGNAFAAGGPGGNAIGGDAFATQQMARQILTTIAGAPGGRGGDGVPGASVIGGVGGVGGIGGIGGNARGGDVFAGIAPVAGQILTTIAGAPGGKGGDAIAAARESSSLMRTLVGPTNLISELRKETVNTERFENSTIREIRETGARALGGPVTAGGMYRVNERAPEVLSMGGKQWMMPMQDGKVTPQSGGDQRTYNVTVNQNFPSNVSRETIAQGGTKAGRAVQRELSRGTA